MTDPTFTREDDQRLFQALRRPIHGFHVGEQVVIGYEAVSPYDFALAVLECWGEPECAKPLKEALESVGASMSFHPRDWSRDHRDAWVYGIVNGWSQEALQELAQAHKWKPETVQRLQRLRAAVSSVATPVAQGLATPRPVPVAERPWERDGWCDDRGLCWWALGTVQRWTLCYPANKTEGWMLPAHALPLPQENTDD